MFSIEQSIRKLVKCKIINKFIFYFVIAATSPLTPSSTSAFTSYTNASAIMSSVPSQVTTMHTPGSGPPPPPPGTKPCGHHYLSPAASCTACGPPRHMFDNALQPFLRHPYFSGK